MLYHLQKGVSNRNSSAQYSIGESSKVPTEQHPTSSSEEQENKLNAAAAREISRELEYLNSGHDKDLRQRPSSIEASIERGSVVEGTTIIHDGYSDKSRDSSPLAPPSAPFARRSVSPHPLIETSAVSSRQFPIVGQHGAGQSQTVGPSHGMSYISPYVVGQSPLHSPKSIAPRTQYLTQRQEPEGPPRSQGVSPNPGYQIPRFQGSNLVSSSSATDLQSLPPIKPNAPFNSSPGGASPKTISAAAFKRSRKRSSSADNPEFRAAPPYPILNVSPNPPSESGYVDTYMGPSSHRKTEFDFQSKQRESFNYKGQGAGEYSTDLDGNLLR